MGKKRRHSATFFRSKCEVPVKTSKVQEEKNTSSNSDDEKSEKIIGQLTPAELVGRNHEIMNLVIRNINNVHQRMKISNACKLFNIICNSKKSYVESFKNKFEKRWWMYFLEEESLFILNGDILIINISHFSRSITKKLQVIKHKVIMNRHKITTIKIKNLPSGYLNYFKELNCFENVETLYFDVLKLKFLPFAIFDLCPSLKPDTIIFGNVLNHDFDYTDKSRAVYNNEKYAFPTSVKNIHIICETENADWMINAFENFEPNQLDTLFLGEFYIECLTATGTKHIISIMQFFKNVQFKVCKNIHSAYNEYFTQTVADFYITGSFSLTFDMNFNVSKCDNEIWASENPPCVEKENKDNRVLFENVSINERYLHINGLKIDRFNIFTEYKLGTDEIISLKEGLLKMPNMTTLEMDFDLITSGAYFVFLCCGLAQNLKNIKLFNCDNLNLTELMYLSIHCPNIENFCLEDIKSPTITIKNILSLFTQLKGLEMKFSSNYSVMSIIKDVIKKKEEEQYYVLDWPQIHFLNIFCSLPNKEEKELLSMVEEKTPRKSGKFLMMPTMVKNKTLWQMIIQKNTNYIYYFHTKFNKPYIF